MNLPLTIPHITLVDVDYYDVVVTDYVPAVDGRASRDRDTWTPDVRAEVRLGSAAAYSHVADSRAPVPQSVLFWMEQLYAEQIAEAVEESRRRGQEP